MRTGRERRGTRAKHCHLALGSFEARVMEVLWRSPECTVHQVKERLVRKRAYTTVMTTLVRLYQKGLLARRKRGHQFVYVARVSAQEWGRMAASEFVNKFAADPNITRGLLISSLLHALDTLDPQLSAEMQAQMLHKDVAGAKVLSAKWEAEKHPRSTTKQIRLRK